MLRISVFSRCIAILTLVAYCLLPVAAQALTIGEERKVGEYLLYSVRKEFPVLDDPDISQYINGLGRNVLQIVGPQYFDYRFFVVKSEQFNAFAAPGGLVFFYTGLIQSMQTEDQLLSVMAHEIGHVVSRHIAQQLDKGTKVSVLSLLAGVAGLAIGVPGLSQGLLTGSLAMGQTINLQYSRENEEQADRLSFGWLQKMNRDPEAMEGMLKSMQRISRYAMGSQVPQYLLTHPNPDARLGYVESLLEAAPKKPYKTTDNFEFLRFKYRVLMEASDHDDLRVMCTNLQNGEGTMEQRIMSRFGLALLAADEGKFDLAFDHLAAVQKAYPNKNILEIDRAVLMIQAGRYADAASLLEQLVSRDPTSMYGVYQLARVELLRGNERRAEPLLQRVAANMPEFPQVYFDLGQIETNRGRAGVGVFYLGKYNLYRGKLKFAKQYLNRASKDTTVPEAMRNEAKATVEKLKELEKEV